MKFTVIGERCSGTNYLQELISANFYNVHLTWECGFKHWFKKWEASNDVLILGIVRNPIDWLHSLYTCLHNIPDQNKSLPGFLLNEYYSCQNDEIITSDLKVKYQNIFELRFLKNNFLLNMKNKPNFVLINYEELRSNTEDVLLKLKNRFNLHFKHDKIVEVNYYVGWGHERGPGVKYVKKEVDFSPETLQIINENINKDQELLLGYFLCI
jgi:hypothetical protein